MIGDLVADITSVASATASFDAAGGVGPWLLNRVQTFRTLPGSYAALADQIARASAVLNDSGMATNDAADLLRSAKEKVDAAQRLYPATAERVDRLTLALLPVSGKLANGNLDAEVIGKLLGSGVDIVQTAYQVNDLIAKRDEASTLLQRAVTSPSLAVTTREKMIAAMAGGGISGIVKVGVLLVIGYVVIRSVMK